MIAYIGLGSNLGRREASVLAAVRALETSGAARVNAVSSLYESEADGIAHAPWPKLNLYFPRAFC
jgi:7,8-dihydro-6-hydroxymethylpterin-pyrophosphokinase